MKNRTRQYCWLKKDGFTLVEMLVALMVTSIVLGGVATLAFAMGKANDIGEDMSRNMANVRYTTLRLTELLRNCKLICAKNGNDLAIWLDDSNADGMININEICYLETGAAANYIRLTTFDDLETYPVTLSYIQYPDSKQTIKNVCLTTTTDLIKECTKVQIRLDNNPPWTKFINISFNLAEEGLSRQYQVNAAMRCSAENIIDKTGTTIVTDDD